VIEDLLRQFCFSVDPIHDLHPWMGRFTGRIEEPGKTVGFATVAELGQGIEDEGGIAQPALAVVPVTLPSDLLGERGGWRGHDGTAGA
jgi:PHP family Zn ribbon phosphoesterase